MITAEHWTEQAVCTTTDPEIFFATESGDILTVRHALDFCRQCPVMQACLQFALEQRIEEGIWGGTTERERRSLRRRSERRTHCRNGHEFTEGSFTLKSSGHRRCLACHNAANREQYAKKKAAEGRTDYTTDRTHCIHGHTWELGQRRCKECAAVAKAKHLAAQPRNTRKVCDHGDANLGLNGLNPDGSQKWACRACLSTRRKAARKARKADAA